MWHQLNTKLSDNGEYSITQPVSLAWWKGSDSQALSQHRSPYDIQLLTCFRVCNIYVAHLVKSWSKMPLRMLLIGKLKPIMVMPLNVNGGQSIPPLMEGLSTISKFANITKPSDLICIIWIVFLFLCFLQPHFTFIYSLKKNMSIYSKGWDLWL